MKRKTIFAAALVLAATPAPSIAQDQGNYFVRNDTRATLSCGLRRARGSTMDRFVLEPGAEWQSEQAGDRPRVLICDVGEILPHFRLRPGIRYSVIEGSRGSVTVRIAGS